MCVCVHHVWLIELLPSSGCHAQLIHLSNVVVAMLGREGCGERLITFCRTMKLYFSINFIIFLLLISNQVLHIMTYSSVCMYVCVYVYIYATWDLSVCVCVCTSII